jgi:hypothetical protein
MATIKKLSTEQFRNLVLEKTRALKKKMLEEEAIKALEDPLEVDMNANDGTEDSDKALVFKNKDNTKTKKGKESSDDPMKVKVEAEGEKGSDEKAAAAVKVEAGAEKGGKGPTDGQKKANFTAKKDGPKDSVSGPFTEKGEKEMNTMDKLTDEETKTYVEASGTISGDGPTAGQNKASVKEKAPNADQKEERIAKGIETGMGEGNKDGEADKNATNVKPNITLKESYTKKELIETIKREAAKIARKKMLQEELKRIDEELKNL